MSESIKMISNFEYKHLFLPGLSQDVLQNEAKIQLYRIENYLRNILIPVLPYRTTFNFIIFVTQGRIKQQLEVLQHDIEAGNILVIKQGSITATLEISEDTEGFFLVYENEEVEKMSIQRTQDFSFFLSSPFARLDPPTEDWLASLFKLMEQELTPPKINLEVANVLLKAALMKIIPKTNESEISLKRNLYITLLFKELLQEHHLKERKVDFYANKLAITENYLCKCIKGTTGKPPKQWISELNILHSQILLQDISKDISDIAFELNYHSLSYFTRQFKKLIGISPSEFRRSISLIG